MSMNFLNTLGNFAFREGYFTELPKFAESINSTEIHSFEDADRSLNNTGTGFVKPHTVNEYTRGDGRIVSGYYRDGDGDQNTNLTVEQGGGYYR